MFLVKMLQFKQLEVKKRRRYHLGKVRAIRIKKHLSIYPRATVDEVHFQNQISLMLLPKTK